MNPDTESKFKLLTEKIMDCRRCRLCETRTNVVPGDGSPDADIMFIGEGPGKNEDLQGIPFVGAAGKFLDEMMSEAGIPRSSIFITNIVKCRPPGNRDPKPDEILLCKPYLQLQVKLIHPKLLCVMGNPACRTLISPEVNISKIHGRFFNKKNWIMYALYHPAAALYNTALKATLTEDMMKLAGYLKKTEDYSVERL